MRSVVKFLFSFLFSADKAIILNSGLKKNVCSKRKALPWQEDKNSI